MNAPQSIHEFLAFCRCEPVVEPVTESEPEPESANNSGREASAEQRVRGFSGEDRSGLRRENDSVIQPEPVVELPKPKRGRPIGSFKDLQTARPKVILTPEQRAKRKQYQQKYLEKNKEKTYASYKRYREEHRERFNELVNNSYHRRKFNNLSESEIIEQIQKSQDKINRLQEIAISHFSKPLPQSDSDSDSGSGYEEEKNCE